MNAPQQMLMARSPPVGVVVTWSPTFKSPDIALSGGNLTATATSSSNAAGRADAAVTSALKKYWEILIVVDVNTSVGPGLGNVSAAFITDEWLGVFATTIGYYSDGNVYHNWNVVGAPIATYAGYAAGNRICIAVDEANTKVWFRVNAGNWNNSGADNPATNTGGLNYSGLIGSGDIYPAYNVQGNGIDGQVTANFGATAFTHTPPAGFTGF